MPLNKNSVYSIEFKTDCNDYAKKQSLSKKNENDDDCEFVTTNKLKPKMSISGKKLKSFISGVNTPIIYNNNGNVVFRIDNPSVENFYDKFKSVSGGNESLNFKDVSKLKTLIGRINFPKTADESVDESVTQQDNNSTLTKSVLHTGDYDIMGMLTSKDGSTLVVYIRTFDDTNVEYIFNIVIFICNEGVYEQVKNKNIGISNTEDIKNGLYDQIINYNGFNFNNINLSGHIYYFDGEYSNNEYSYIYNSIESYQIIYNTEQSPVNIPEKSLLIINADTNNYSLYLTEHITYNVIIKPFSEIFSESTENNYTPTNNLSDYSTDYHINSIRFAYDRIAIFSRSTNNDYNSFLTFYRISDLVNTGGTLIHERTVHVFGESPFSLTGDALDRHHFTFSMKEDMNTFNYVIGVDSHDNNKGGIILFRHRDNNTDRYHLINEDVTIVNFGIKVFAFKDDIIVFGHSVDDANNYIIKRYHFNENMGEFKLINTDDGPINTSNDVITTNEYYIIVNGKIIIYDNALIDDDINLDILIEP